MYGFETEVAPSGEEMTELLGKLVGHHEENSLTLHMLVALLEEKGILAPGELDAAVTRFVREHGREYFVEQWGPEIGEGLHEGVSLSQLQ